MSRQETVFELILILVKAKINMERSSWFSVEKAKRGQIDSSICFGEAAFLLATVSIDSKPRYGALLRVTQRHEVLRSAAKWYKKSECV